MINTAIANNVNVLGSGTGAKFVGDAGTAADSAGGRKTEPGPAPLPIVKLDPASSDAAPSSVTIPLSTVSPPPNVFVPLNIIMPLPSLLDMVKEPLPLRSPMLPATSKMPLPLIDIKEMDPASVSGAAMVCEPDSTLISPGRPPELLSVKLPAEPDVRV